MNFSHQLPIITTRQNFLNILQFTNMSGKLHKTGVDKGHLSVPKFNQRKPKNFCIEGKKVKDCLNDLKH